MNAILILLIYSKKIFKIKINRNEEGIVEFYHHLIHTKGRQISQTSDTYLSSFFDKIIKIKLRKTPSSDLKVFNQVFRNSGYKPVIAIYKKYFNSTSPKVIDAGANIGLTSLYINLQFDVPDFILLEPDSNNFKILSFNLKSNSINARVENAGLWSNKANLKIVKDFRDKSDWATRVEETTEKGINAMTVNHLLVKYNWDYIDILKIDIEGSEKEVFTSINADLSFLSKTKCIAIEIHDEFNCREDIYKVFKKYNFICFNYGELTVGVNTKLIEKTIEKTLL
jgi:FkbM family methyltransferase